jgi:hypothetical protein
MFKAGHIHVQIRVSAIKEQGVEDNLMRPKVLSLCLIQHHNLGGGSYHQQDVHQELPWKTIYMELNPFCLLYF